MATRTAARHAADSRFWQMATTRHVLLIEPFYGGSHGVLIDTVVRGLFAAREDPPGSAAEGDAAQGEPSEAAIGNAATSFRVAARRGGSKSSPVETTFMRSRDDGLHVTTMTLSAKKWQWRLRTSAVLFANALFEACEAAQAVCGDADGSGGGESDDRSPCGSFHGWVRPQVVFLSSMTNAAELRGLVPWLHAAHVVLYFHENQLEYPTRSGDGRPKGGDAAATEADAATTMSRGNGDFAFGWAQVVSCMAADRVLFNSCFNMTSFLERIPRLLKTSPPPRIAATPLVDGIRRKSDVLYFPVPDIPRFRGPFGCRFNGGEQSPPLRVAWVGRWEYDKDPDFFFNAVMPIIEDDAERGAAVPAIQLIVLGEAFPSSPPVFSRVRDRLMEHPGRFDRYVHHWGYANRNNPAGPDYFSLLAQADVVVSTAIHEFFGVGVLEAVAHGCYPLLRKNQVYPEFFDKPHLFATEAQLRKALVNLVRRPEIVRSDWAGFDVGARFSWAALAPAYLRELRVDGPRGGKRMRDET